MAQKLHDSYNFSYDNLKVLLGGWNTWNQEHAKDPNGYPTEVTEGASTPSGGDTGNPVQLVPTSTIQLQPAPTK